MASLVSYRNIACPSLQDVIITGPKNGVVLYTVMGLISFTLVSESSHGSI